MRGISVHVVALRQRSFRRYLGLNAASTSFLASFYVASAVVIVEAGGATIYSLFLTVQALTQFVALVPGGRLAGKVGSLGVLVTGNVVSSAGVALLAAVSAGLMPSAAVALPVAAFLFGTGGAFVQSSARAFVGETVSAELLGQARGIMLALTGIVAVSAPPLCVLLGGFIGYPFVLVIITLGFALCSVFAARLSRFRVKPEIEPEKEESASEEPLRAVFRRSPWLLVTMAQNASLSMLVFAPLTVLLRPFSIEHFGPSGLGSLLAAEAAGSIVGTALSVRPAPRLPGVFAASAFIAYAIVPATLVLPDPPLILVCAAMCIGTMLIRPSVTWWFVALTRTGSSANLTKLHASDLLGPSAGEPLGYAIGGLLIAVLPLPVMAAGIALGSVVAGGLPLFSRGYRHFATPEGGPRREEDSS